ncbi:MAG: glycosyltransferase family 39 protein [Desulfuromonas sp.]|nr:glycosyltransferase family 39 protein [Desulfuromonas sp.]
MGSLLLKHRALLLIMALSICLKLLFVWQGAVVNPDAATYIAAAQKHAHGLYSEGVSYYRMPFYPWLLSIVHVLIPNWIYAGQLLTIVPLVLCLLPLYSLTLRIFDHHVALVSSLMFALLPAFNTLATSIIRDPLFLMFSLTAILLLILAFQQNRLRWWLWFSLFSVLAILTRIEGVLIPVVATILVPFYFRNVKKDRISSLLYVGTIALIPLLLVALIILLKALGIESFSRLNEVVSWVWQLVSLKLFVGYNNLLEQLKIFQSSLPRADLHNNLLEIVRHYAPIIYLIGLSEMLVKIIFPTSLLALWIGRGTAIRSMSKERWILILLSLLTVLLNLLFSMSHNFTTERYLWLAAVAILPWISSGVVVCLQRFSSRPMVVVLMVILFVGAPLAKTLMAGVKTQDRTIVAAGRWLQDYDSSATAVVMYNDRRLPLYANRVEDVNLVRSLAWMRSSAKKQKDISLLVLYVSNEKKGDTEINGFDVVNRFEGDKKTVIFLQRRDSLEY